MLQITIFDTKIEYFFAAKKSPYLRPQSPYLKTQISLFEPKKISHVWSRDSLYSQNAAWGIVFFSSFYWWHIENKGWMGERLLNLQKIFVSGQNICIEVYGNSAGTFTPATAYSKALTATPSDNWWNFIDRTAATAKNIIERSRAANPQHQEEEKKDKNIHFKTNKQMYEKHKDKPPLPQAWMLLSTLWYDWMIMNFSYIEFL